MVFDAARAKGDDRHKTKRSAPVSAAQARAANERKLQLKRRLHGLHDHMHSVRAKIHQVKVKEHQIGEGIQTVESRIRVTRGRIERVHTKLTHLAQQHDNTVARLDATQQRLVKRRQLLRRRIQDNYLRGQISYAHVLLEAASLHEMLSRSVYVRQIVRSDAALIHGVQQDIAQIEADKRLLEDQARQNQQLAAEFEDQKKQYYADVERRQGLLHQTRLVRVQAEGELDELEGESEAMSERIRSLSEMLRRRRQAELDEIAARRRASRSDNMRRSRAVASRHRQSGQRNQGDPGDDGATDPQEIAPEWHGEFIKPAEGPFTSPFGYRYHPILHRRKLHTGVDIGAHYGAPIHAAGDGTVIVASYSGGYGNCVIIDHGGGVTTLYGHCSAILVSEGQTVRQGQVIARVGATGLATGPHLHFEVRHNGTPVAPF
jgi:murein DD-endopeptidase MepM/ murein hydrolase activator NlpD